MIDYVWSPCFALSPFTKTSPLCYLWTPLREVLVWFIISFDHRATQSSFISHVSQTIAHVIKGTDKLSGAFASICAEFQRAAALSKILCGLLEYGILLPWISVTGNIYLCLMGITKGLSDKIDGINMLNGKTNSRSR